MNTKKASKTIGVILTVLCFFNHTSTKIPLANAHWHMCLLSSLCTRNSRKSRLRIAQMQLGTVFVGSLINAVIEGEESYSEHQKRFSPRDNLLLFLIGGGYLCGAYFYPSSSFNQSEASIRFTARIAFLYNCIVNIMDIFGWHI